MRKLKFIIYVLLIVGLFQYLEYRDFKNFTIKEDIVVTVEENQFPRWVLINNFGLKKLHLQLSGYDKEIRHMRPGRYSFNSGDNFETIIDKLNSGPIKEITQIRILPGWNIFDIDKYLTDNLLITKGEYINEARNVEKYLPYYDFLSNKNSLEGYLFPDTYFIDLNTFSVEQTITRQLNTFKTKVYDELLKNKTKNEIDELVKISSIVEREEPSNINQPTVAGILIKRYKENWMIGADITACYPFEYTEHECRLNLSKHIRDVNDYNTRTMRGLPKTAINNPSFNTIKNTLNYKTTPYYFYLHNTDTKEIFYAVTNAEHEANRRFMRK